MDGEDRDRITPTLVMHAKEKENWDSCLPPDFLRPLSFCDTTQDRADQIIQVDIEKLFSPFFAHKVRLSSLVIHFSPYTPER